MKATLTTERIVKMFKVAFTGHRDSKLPFCGENDPKLQKFRSELNKKIIEMISDGATEFFSGMALGVDTYAAEEVLKLKKQYPEVNLTAVIPCLEQDSLWTAAQKQKYCEILAQCSRQISTSLKYDKSCMFKRNRGLVDMCDVLIAVIEVNNVGGGTHYTVNYALKKGRRVIKLYI